MLSAIVLLNTERDKTNKVAEALADTDGVTEVYSVAGRYDLAAIVRASDNDQLAKIVTEHIRASSGNHRLGDADRVSRLFAPRFGADVFDRHGKSLASDCKSLIYFVALDLLASTYREYAVRSSILRAPRS